jgi:hypothetical protein
VLLGLCWIILLKLIRLRGSILENSLICIRILSLELYSKKLIKIIKSFPVFKLKKKRKYNQLNYSNNNYRNHYISSHRSVWYPNLNYSSNSNKTNNSSNSLLISSRISSKMIKFFLKMITNLKIKLLMIICLMIWN